MMPTLLLLQITAHAIILLIGHLLMSGVRKVPYPNGSIDEIIAEGDRRGRRIDTIGVTTIILQAVILVGFLFAY